MCGIAGYVVEPPGAGERLAAMGAALAHRGPDDRGEWREAGVGLAHRRLSVLDLSAAGRQPMQDASGRYVVTYNGEIFNYLELRAELEKRGARFRTGTDTEVLLEAWAAWGAGALARCNGMFALAIYDRKTRRLTLARDRLGVKPLYYVERGGGLAFASELRALRAGGFLPDALDAGALAAYFTYLYVPGPETVYPGVRALPPGCTLTWDAGETAIQAYWTLDCRIDAAWTLDAAAERYRELLRDAVRLRMRSDAPQGAFLSGGLDSSSVAACMRREHDGPLHAFTIGFDDRDADELRFARAVARHIGAEHHEAIVHPDAAALAPRLVAHFDQPFADSSALPAWLVSEMARRRITVALSGDGGDELFAGYAWAHMAWRAARWGRMPRPVRALAASLARWAPAGPRTRRVRRFLDDAELPRADAFRRRLTCFGPEERAALFHPETARAAVDRFAAWWEAAAPLDADDRMLHVDTRMYLPDDILAKVDRMSMAHGLEVRTPLLDYRIVEFAATVPFSLKFNGIQSKRLVKRAVGAWLPRETLRQRKRGFAIPIQSWFRGTLGDLYADAVLAPDARCRDWLAPDALETLLARHRARQAEHGHHLWAVLILELWLRAHHRAAADV